MTSSKEKHDGVGTKQRKMYPTSPEAYELHEEIGLGVSAWVRCTILKPITTILALSNVRTGAAQVYRAVCLAFNEVVAIKIMDLDNTEISTLVRSLTRFHCHEHALAISDENTLHPGLGRRTRW